MAPTEGVCQSKALIVLGRSITSLSATIGLQVIVI
jgi:hypothetical protein